VGLASLGFQGITVTEKMAEDANSWIRRTKFSHTVCHRLDSSILAPIQLTILPERNSGLKSRPATTSASEKSVANVSRIQRNPIINKQRSLSPLPETSLSDTFKEARSERKRFTTPVSRRREPEKGIIGKFMNKDSQEIKGSSSNSSPLRHLASLKFNEKSKTRKDLLWAKYFDHGGGRVNAVETADEWCVDLSKLFLGLKFAHGAHSRLYHGIYNDKPVAVKIIRVPDDDENGALAARLEKQFVREVTLLSGLHHQNVIKVIKLFLFLPFSCSFVIYMYLSLMIEIVH
jgi:hypothetical protein